MNQNKLIRRELRHQFHPVGWSLVVYYLLMNFVVIFWGIGSGMINAIISLLQGDFSMNQYVEDTIASLGWGYGLTITIGFVVLLLWKKPAYFKNELFVRGKPMTFGAFAGLLCVFLSVQLVTAILNNIIELVLNMMGLTMMAALESSSGMQEGLAMFIYASILAPISEEILFRGLIQRSLLPFGKKFAVFGSALLFGIFHGNLAQTPFAFLAGLVLGYVAVEYNLIWAMVLHMVNNLVLADMLTRLTSFLPATVSELIMGLIILVFGIVGVVVLVVKHKRVGQWLRQEKMNKLCVQALISHPGVIVLMILTFLNGLLLFSKL